MAATWTGTADAYEVSFGRLCAGTIDPLMKELGPSLDGERLLDVGCGPGSLTATARRAGFDVTGVDADYSMVELAQRRHPSLAFAQAALPHLPFPDGAFDRVAANFVINHNDDPRAAVREAWRVTTPTGRLAITVWSNAISPMNQLWNDVMAAAAVEPPGKSLPAERDFPRTVAGLVEMMSLHGLISVSVSEVSWTFRIAPDDLWCAVEGRIATIGATYHVQDEVTRNEMAAAYRRLTEPYCQAGLLELPSTALLAIGTRPD